MYNRYKERIETFLAKKPDYKKMYEDERKRGMNWEFKYNKLYRQLGAILSESEQ